MRGLGSIVTNGIDVVLVMLDGDNDSPGSSWYYGTGPDGAKGWYAIANALAVTTDLTKAVDAGTGVSTFGLADLSDSGAGAALRKFTRDAKGRVSGTQAATTSDLPEGTNLYFTPERGQDATGAAITAGTFDGLTLTYDDAGNRINGANTDKGSTAVAAHVAQADPHPQYTTTAEASAAAPVQSINGETGAVSVTPANIGAATAAQGAKADSALQDAPSDGATYGRKNGAWAAVTGGSGAVTSVTHGPAPSLCLTSFLRLLHQRRPITAERSLTVTGGATPTTVCSTPSRKAHGSTTTPRPCRGTCRRA
ncbi:hypothetical protein EBA12_08700 [Xanthomonas oryzae pv. oryzae]|nr:hypothetical protein EBA12_08700 [Xanthomonas oryzae pv. oryzae]